MAVHNFMLSMLISDDKKVHLGEIQNAIEKSFKKDGTFNATMVSCTEVVIEDEYEEEVAVEEKEQVVEELIVDKQPVDYSAFSIAI